MMASQGILERLSDCNVQVVDVYGEPLSSLDLLWAISSKKWRSEDIFNQLMKKEQNQLLNWMSKLRFTALQKQKIELLLSEYISKSSPDMVISCISMINSMLLDVANQLNLPFLVITTDIDISDFCYGFLNHDQLVGKDRFRISVPFSKTTWGPEYSNHLPKCVKSSLQYSFAYPTRFAFSQTFDESTLNRLREEYQIQQDENVILVMMGGNTSQAPLYYAKLLLGMSENEIREIVGSDPQRTKIRLICLCGDLSQKMNRTLMLQLDALNQSVKLNKSVTIHACPGTPHIAQLVSLPEMKAVISKPGGSTVNEMIKKKMPMVYHVSTVPLEWEKGNLTYGVSRGLGKAFQLEKEIDDKVRTSFVKTLAFLFVLHTEIQEGRKIVPEASFDFTINLRSAVREMLSSSHY